MPEQSEHRRTIISLNHYKEQFAVQYNGYNELNHKLNHQLQLLL